MPPNKPSRRSRARLKKKERELALCLNCLLGYEEEGLYSSVVIDFIAPEVKDFSKTRVRAKTEGIYETIGVRKDRSTFPIEINAWEYTIGGKCIRITAAQDLTEQKRWWSSYWTVKIALKN